MRKVEFPAFFHEPPTLIFGRTGRELVVIACGMALGYYMWNSFAFGSVAAAVLRIFLTVIPVVASVVIARVSIAERPLEEWAFVLLLYVLTPKFYQYVPFDAEEDAHKYSVDIEYDDKED